MRLVCISDTHGRHKKLKPDEMPVGDVLCVAGDITPSGEPQMLSSFVKWLNKLDYKYKIIIAGNHDWCFARDSAAKQEFKREEGNIYLEDSGVTIGGINFYGSPWQPEFCNWAFNLPRGPRLKRIWEAVPENTDVLITHGPPAGYLDLVIYDNEHVGCVDLKEEIINRIHPKVHVFGHIHCDYGTIEDYNCKFVNASICTESYDPDNSPIIIEIPHEGEI